jgi:uncharacterized membrane protein HdeD (DUF308 family)
MFTFGYTNRFTGPFRALIALATGVVMIVYKEQAMDLVVKIIAAFLLASGFVSLAVGLRKKNDSSSKLMTFNAVVDVLIAALLFLFSGAVANLIIYLIGFVVLGFGIFQLIALISANRVSKVGIFALVMPVLVIGAGAFLLFNPEFIKSSVSLVAGIALLIYGASELLSSWKMKKAIDEYEITRMPQDKPAEEPVAEVKDVDYEKVDEQ